MSYVCLLANRNGAVVAGDTRETIDNIFHWDHRRKIFKSEDGKILWAMCGLTRYFGVDYFRRISLLLKKGLGTQNDLDTVKAVAGLAAKGTSWQYKWSHKRSSLTAFICFVHGERMSVFCISSVNGKSVITRKPVPCALEGGSGTVNIKRIKLEEIVELDLDKLYERAQKQTALAIEADQKKKKETKKYISTVGGDVIAEKVRYAQQR